MDAHTPKIRLTQDETARMVAGLTVRLNDEAIQRLTNGERYSSPSDLARQAGIAPSAMTRVINRTIRPSPRFIARLLYETGEDFHELFIITDD